MTQAQATHGHLTCPTTAAETSNYNDDLCLDKVSKLQNAPTGISEANASFILSSSHVPLVVVHKPGTAAATVKRYIKQTVNANAKVQFFTDVQTHPMLTFAPFSQTHTQTHPHVKDHLTRHLL